QLFGQPVDRARAFRFRCLGDDSEGRPAQAVDAEQARPKRGALFLIEGRRIAITPKRKRPRNRPLAGICRVLENKGVRRIKPDSTWQLQHGGTTVVAGPALSESYQAHRDKPSSKLIRTGAV